MNRPRILDLFSGSGGCAEGYRRAGLIPFGVDLAPMPRYPYQFKRADALDFLRRYGREFDVIHASPPCQDYSELNAIHKKEYPRLIEPVRELLIQLGKPYVIENVEGARSELRQPITLCGVMFPELRVYRHRLFESNVPLTPPYVCSGYHHDNTPRAGGGVSSKGYATVAGNGGVKNLRDIGIQSTWLEYASMAMGINWMTRAELSGAIPPQYTHWIGAQLMQHLGLTPLSWPTVRAVQERLFA